jgi:Fe-S oxidoreductase
MFSDDVIASFGEFKAVFDPGGVLNPGVLVDPDPVDANVRPVRPRSVSGPRGFLLAEDHGDLAAGVHRCVGVGKCVVGKLHGGVVMCPSYAATHDEHHVTRGRARVLQEAVTGGIPDGLTSPAVRASLDWCMACKGCLSDCPAGVDMATYKAEVLHRTYHRRRRPLAHYTLGWLPRWLGLAAVAPWAANLANRVPAVERLVKRLAGIDPQRSVPAFHRRPHLTSAGAGPSRTGAPSALLWVDSFTGHLRPQVVSAAARVLGDAGYSVRTPTAALCCGLTWLTTGQLDGARRRMRRAVDGLDGELATDDIVVGLEPSCTAALRHEAVELLGPDDAPATRVAAATRTLAEALAARPDWVPPRLDGTELIAQPHCHHHAVLGWSADRELLAAAGAQVTAVGGCCGLAGDFGTARGRFDISRRIAETALLPALRAAPGAVPLADGYSCSTQIADLDGRRALHLAELLAGALDRAGR